MFENHVDLHVRLIILVNVEYVSGKKENKKQKFQNLKLVYHNSNLNYGWKTTIKIPDTIHRKSQNYIMPFLSFLGEKCCDTCFLAMDRS